MPDNNRNHLQDQAFYLGQRARCRRTDIEDCPYNDTSMLAKYWRDGWMNEDMIIMDSGECEVG